jgi:hypothetical protein
MKATQLIKKLQALVAREGDFPVELETPHAIVALTKVYFGETDAQRGCTIILESNGKTL